MTPVPIRLVLDTSAVIEFTRASIHVGEVLFEIADEGAVALLPLPCLVEAAPAAHDRDRLEVLATHAAVAVFSEEPAQWKPLAAVLDAVGQLDSAFAALAAVDADVAVLSHWPRRYAGVGVDVIAIGD